MYVPYCDFVYFARLPTGSVTETYDALYNYDSHSYHADSPSSRLTASYHSHSSFATADVDVDTPEMTHQYPHWPVYHSYSSVTAVPDEETLEMTHDIPNFFFVSSQDNLLQSTAA